MIPVSNSHLKKEEDLVFKTYYKKVVYKFYKSTKNQMLSEDLAMEVIEKVLRSMKTQYNPNLSLGAWVNTIAGNHLIDYYRKNAAKKNSLERSTTYGEYSISCYNKSDESDIDTNEIMLDIKNEIKKLSNQDQTIVKYIAFYNFSYEEVSKELNLSIRTIKNRMNKIKTKIKCNIKVL